MVSRIHSWISGEVLTAAALNAEFDNLITAGNTVATDAVPGPIELATSGEINTGTDASRALTPDAFAGSNFGIRNIGIPCVAPATICTTGDGKNFVEIPASMNGMNLVAVSAAVVTAGTTGLMEIQVRRIRSGAAVDMLSTKVSVDSTETGSSTAATPPVINTSNDDVQTADRIFVDVDAVHTTPAQGLIVTLSFALP